MKTLSVKVIFIFENVNILGDQVTKFKYRQVLPNSYGLDVQEILNAEDQQLNSWVSLKKVVKG